MLTGAQLVGLKKRNIYIIFYSMYINIYSFLILSTWCHHPQPGFGNQFILGYEVEVELSIQLKNENEVEYE